MAGTVIQVGDRGRGFIIATEEARYVITAAHCLLKLPPAHPAAYTEERTCANFLGPFGGTCDVWAECVFADPVADLAVFCQPDNQEPFNQADAYDILIDAATPFTLGRLRFRRPHHRLPNGQTLVGRREAATGAQLLSLDDEWFTCRIGSFGRSLWIEDAAQPVRSGMSGSPIILLDGSAVGVFCTDHGPNPVLFANLPARLVRGAG